MAVTNDFTSSVLNLNGLVTLGVTTALEWGADGRLYVTENGGGVAILTIAFGDIDDDNEAEFYVTEAIKVSIGGPNGVQNYNDDGSINNNDSRQTTGIDTAMQFDENGNQLYVQADGSISTVVTSTPAVTFYVTSSDSRVGAGGSGADENLDTNSGVITKFTQTGENSWSQVDIVTGLPRSEENHATNGLQVLQVLDENGMLIEERMIVASGGNANTGAPSNNFAGQQEQPLSAAILEIDLLALNDLTPTTVDGRTTYLQLQTLDDPTRDGAEDAGDPRGGNDGLNSATLQYGGIVDMYSPGYRNSYDVLVTEDGRVWTYDNGANNTWGGRPVGEAQVGDGTTEPAQDPNYIATNLNNGDGGPNDEISTEDGWNPSNNDNFHEITRSDDLNGGTLSTGAFGDVPTFIGPDGLEYVYGGHPNPTRAEGATAGLLYSPAAGTSDSFLLLADEDIYNDGAPGQSDYDQVMEYYQSIGAPTETLLEADLGVEYEVYVITNTNGDRADNNENRFTYTDADGNEKAGFLVPADLTVQQKADFVQNIVNQLDAGLTVEGPLEDAWTNQVKTTGLPIDLADIVSATNPVQGSDVDAFGRNPIEGAYYEGGRADGALDSGKGSINGLAEYTSTILDGNGVTMSGAILATTFNNANIITMGRNPDGTMSSVASGNNAQAADRTLINNNNGSLGIDTIGDDFDELGLTKAFQGTIWTASFNKSQFDIQILQPGSADNNPVLGQGLYAGSEPFDPLDNDLDGLTNTVDPFEFSANNGYDIAPGQSLLLDFDATAEKFPGTIAGNTGLLGAALDGPNSLAGPLASAAETGGQPTTNIQEAGATPNRDATTGQYLDDAGDLANPDLQQDGLFDLAGNLIPGGNAPLYQIKEVVPGTMVGVGNTARDAVHTAIKPSADVGRVQATLTMKNWVPSQGTVADGQLTGLVYGDGTQSNFLRVVFGKVGDGVGIEVGYELGDSGYVAIAQIPVSDLELSANDLIELRLNIIKEDFSVQVEYRLGGSNESDSNFINDEPFTAIDLSGFVLPESVLRDVLTGDHTITDATTSTTLTSGAAIGLVAETSEGNSLKAIDFNQLEIEAFGNEIFADTEAEAEASGSDGVDTVIYTGPTADIELANNVENINASGSSGDLNITGNALDNTFTLGSGSNTVTTGDGSDTIVSTSTNADGLEVTDFQNGDKVVLTDVDLAGANISYGAGTAQVTVNGATITFSGPDFENFDPATGDQVFGFEQTDQGMEISLTPAETVIYRVNAGGGAGGQGTIAAIDGGPDWIVDTELAGTGASLTGATSNTFSNGLTNAQDEIDYDNVDAAIVPWQVFVGERSDNSAADPKLTYNFAVEAGQTYKIEVFYTENWQNVFGFAAGNGGQGRQFDIAVEGEVPAAFTDLNPLAEAIAFVGSPAPTANSASDAEKQPFLGVARKAEFIYTAGDDTLTLEWLHDAENPKVNAIQISQLGGVVNPPSDTTAPVVTSITVENPQNVQDGTRDATVVVTDETGFDIANLNTLDGSELQFSGIVPSAVSAPVVTLSNDGQTATLVYTLTPPADNNAWPSGVGDIAIAAGVFADAAGNTAEAATGSFIVEPNLDNLVRGNVLRAVNVGTTDTSPATDLAPDPLDGNAVDNNRYAGEIAADSIITDAFGNPVAFEADDASYYTSPKSNGALNNNVDGQLGATGSNAGGVDLDGSAYHTYRDSTADVWTGTYDGFANGVYIVELHFAELFHGAANARVGDFSINGVLVGDDYDAFVAGGDSADAPSFIRVPVEVTNGEIVVEVDSSQGQAGYSAIVVYEAVPSNLPPTISVGDVTVSEEDGAAVVTFNRLGDQSEDITIDYAIQFESAGLGDIGVANPPAQVVIPANQGSAQVTIPIINDDLEEGAETFTVAITGVSNTSSDALISDGTATVTIEASDASLQIPAGGALFALDFETAGDPFVEGGFDGALGGQGAIEAEDITIQDGKLVIQTDNGDLSQGTGVDSKNDLTRTTDLSDPALEDLYVSTRFANPFTADVLGDGVTEVLNFSQVGIVVGDGTQSQNSLVKMVWGGVAGSNAVGGTGVQIWTNPGGQGNPGFSTTVNLDAMVPAGVSLLDVAEVELSLAFDKTANPVTVSGYVTLFDAQGNILGGARPANDPAPGFATMGAGPLPEPINAVLSSETAQIGVTSSDFQSGSNPGLESFEASWDFLTVTSPQFAEATGATAALTGPSVVAEDAGTATYTVTLSEDPSAATQITVDVTAGSVDPASLPADAELAAGGTQLILTFNPGGGLSQNFDVAIADDTLPELTETFDVAISGLPITSGASGVVTTQITDNDGALDSFNALTAPTGDFSDDRLAPTEVGDLQDGDNVLVAHQQGDLAPGGRDRDYITFTVPEGKVLVSLTLDSYSNIDGSDNQGFMALQQGSQVTIDPVTGAPDDLQNPQGPFGGLIYGEGDLNGNLLLSLLAGDADVQDGVGFPGFGDGQATELPAGTYTLWLNQGGTATNTQFTLALQDVQANDPDPNLVNITGIAPGAEGEFNASFGLSLDQQAQTDTVIDFIVSGGTATSGEDFTPFTGQVTIPQGSLGATIIVDVIDDSDVEATETVEITLTGISQGDANVQLGDTVIATTSIDSDDTAPVFVRGDVIDAVNAGGPALTFNGIDFRDGSSGVGGDPFGDTIDNGAANPFDGTAFTDNGAGNGLQPVFDGTIYQTEINSNADGGVTPKAFTATFPVPEGATSVFIDLYFAELFQDAAGDRVFNVLVNGVPVLQNFDIIATTGDFNTPYVFSPTEPFTPDENGNIVISFEGVADRPVVSGIVITEALEASAPPTVDQGIADQDATEDSAFTFQVPADAFADDQGAANLTLTASLLVDNAAQSLPAWLSFDADTGTFTGTPLNEDVGAITVRVVATDASNQPIFTDFTLTTANTNDAPTVSGSVADALVLEGENSIVDVSAVTAADEDIGDTATLGARLQGGAPLPAGISLVGSQLNIADDAVAGEYVIELFATDTSQAESVSSVAFTLTVSDITPSVISLTGAPSVQEGEGATLNFTLVSSEAAIGDVTVTYAIDGVEQAPVVVTFGPDQTDAVLAVPAPNDEVNDGDDSIEVTLISVEGYPNSLGTVSATGTVTEDDPLNPSDIDGDTILNTDDPFAYDTDNGAGRKLEKGVEFRQDFNTDTADPFSAEGGFTGILVNPGFDYGNPADPAADPYGNRTNEGKVSIADGRLNIVSSQQDAFATGTGTTNTLADAYQSAVDVSGTTKFEVVAVANGGLPNDEGVFEEGTFQFEVLNNNGFEQFGVVLGAGGVDDFVKLVISDENDNPPRIQVAHNNSLVGGEKNISATAVVVDDVIVDYAFTTDTGGTVNLNDVGDIEFRLMVDESDGANGSVTGRVEFFAHADGASLGVVTTPAYAILENGSLDQILTGANPLTGVEGGLAYGVFVTDFGGSGGADINRFTASYDHLSIRSLDPFTLTIGDSAGATEGDEGTTDLLFPLTMSDGFSGTLDIVYTVNDGEEESADGVVFTNGAASLALPFANDDLANGDQAVTIQIVSTSNDLVEIDPAADTGAGTLTEDDFAPVANPDSESVFDGASITFDPAANDTDADNLTGELTVTAIDTAATVGGTVLLNNDGTVTVTADSDSQTGDIVFGYTVSDPGGNTANGTATVTTQANTLVAIAATAAVEAGDSGFTPLNFAITTNPAAADQTISVSYTAGADPVTVDILLDANGEGTLSLADAVANDDLANGDEVITVELASVNTAGFLVDEAASAADGAVSEDDFAPVAAPDTAILFAGGQTTINVLLNDTDADDTDFSDAPGDATALSAALTSDPGVEGLDISIDAGVVTVSASAAVPAGDYTVDYTVTDPGGNADTAGVLTITVAADALVSIAAAPEAVESGDDGATTLVFPISVSPVVADQSIDIEYSLDGGVTSFSQSVALTGGAGALSVAVADFNDDLANGADTVTVTLVNITTLGFSVDTAAATGDITEDDFAPTAVADTLSTPEDTPITFNPAANDTDQDSDDALLKVTAIDTTSTVGGVVELNAETGEVTVTPNQGYVGDIVFGYTVADDAGNTAVSTATVTVDDTPPTISVAPNAEAAEGDGVVEFLVSLSKPSSEVVVVTFSATEGGGNPATAGDDFAAIVGGTFEIPANTTQIAIPVAIVNDSITEEIAETFAFAITAAELQDSSEALTITQGAAIGSISAETSQQATNENPNVEINETDEEVDAGQTDATITGDADDFDDVVITAFDEGDTIVIDEAPDANDPNDEFEDELSVVGVEEGSVVVQIGYKSTTGGEPQIITTITFDDLPDPTAETAVTAGDFVLQTAPGQSGGTDVTLQFAPQTQVISLSAPSLAEVDEENLEDPVLVNLQLATPPANGQSIQVDVDLGGTATLGEDYKLFIQSGSGFQEVTGNFLQATFTDQSTSLPIFIEFQNDELAEDPEAVTITLSGARDADTNDDLSDLISETNTVSVTINSGDIDTTPIVIEAEDFTGLGQSAFYSQFASTASGFELIRLVEGGSGEVATDLSAVLSETGLFDVIIHYYDENDGQSSAQVNVNDNQVGEWTFDNDGPGNGTQSSNLTSVTFTGVALGPDSSFSIAGQTDGQEMLRLDRVEFIRTGDVNLPPTVALQNAITELPENTDTVASVKLADIVITDDGVGVNDISLTGDNADLFEIVAGDAGPELHLKAATALDFEVAASLNVVVNVDDAAIGAADEIEASAPFTLSVTDVNEAPTSLTLLNALVAIDENANAAASVKIADIALEDDALGTVTLGLTGANADLFEIVDGTEGPELHLKAASDVDPIVPVLDFETLASLEVAVTAEDAEISAVLSTPTLILPVNDLDEAAPTVEIVSAVLPSITDAITVVVAIADDTAVDISSIDGDELVITSDNPADDAQLALPVTPIDNGDGTFTYTYLAPLGGWSGTNFTATPAAGSVFDTAPAPNANAEGAAAAFVAGETPPEDRSQYALAGDLDEDGTINSLDQDIDQDGVLNLDDRAAYNAGDVGFDLVGSGGQLGVDFTTLADGVSPFEAFFDGVAQTADDTPELDYATNNGAQVTGGRLTFQTTDADTNDGQQAFTRLVDTGGQSFTIEGTFDNPVFGGAALPTFSQYGLILSLTGAPGADEGADGDFFKFVTGNPGNGVEISGRGSFSGADTKVAYPAGVTDTNFAQVRLVVAVDVITDTSVTFTGTAQYLDDLGNLLGEVTLAPQTADVGSAMYNSLQGTGEPIAFGVTSTDFQSGDSFTVAVQDLTITSETFVGADEVAPTAALVVDPIASINDPIVVVATFADDASGVNLDTLLDGDEVQLTTDGQLQVLTPASSFAVNGNQVTYTFDAPVDGWATDPTPSVVVVENTFADLAGNPNLTGTPVNVVINGVGEPVEEIVLRINAFGPSVAATDDGPIWQGDGNGAPNSQYLEVTNDRGDVQGYSGNPALLTDAGLPEAVADTARSSNEPFSYNIPVSDLRGNGAYRIEFFVAELFTGNQTAGDRIFDISVEGATEGALDNLDPSAGIAQAGDLKVVSYETVVTDGVLNIQFAQDLLSGSDNPIINGIQVTFLGDSLPDEDGPTAGLAITPIDDAESPIVVVATFADNASGVDFATLDGDEVQVTDNGQPVSATNFVVDAIAGTVTYTFEAPEGGWTTDPAPTASVVAGTFADLAGNANLAGAPINVAIDSGVNEAEAIAILEELDDVDSGASYAPDAVGAAVLTILDGDTDPQSSNFGSNSFQLTNTGDKQIAAVVIDFRGASFGDSVVDFDGSAGDTTAKQFSVNSAGGTGGFFGTVEETYLFPGADPLPNTTGAGQSSSGGFKGLLLKFDGESGGFVNGETVGFSGDMDPNSIAGLPKGLVDSGAINGWDVGGVGGSELIGSQFTILFDDGTTATGYLHSDNSQTGSIGEAVEDRENQLVSLSIETGGETITSGNAGTYGGTPPIITVTGPANATVRVVMQKGFNPVLNDDSGVADLVANRLAASQPDFQVNNAFDTQTFDVTLDALGQAVLPANVFDYVGATSGVDPFTGSDIAPLAFTAAVIVPVTDNTPDVLAGDSNVAAGPVSNPIYLNNTSGIPVDPDGGDNAPVITANIPNVSVDQNAPIADIDLADVFEDAEDGDNLTYEIVDEQGQPTALPDGLTLVDGVISGTPTTLGSTTVFVRATDTSGLSVTDAFIVSVGEGALGIIQSLTDADGVATGGSYDQGDVGSAEISILAGGGNVQTSNFGDNSFQVTNTGDKKIAAVLVDFRDAWFPDSVIDFDGSAGDTSAKEFEINSDGETGAYFDEIDANTYFFPGVTPLPNTTGTGSSNVSGGFRGVLLKADNTDGGFETNETVGFSGDMDPNSIAGLEKNGGNGVDNGAVNGWDVGGISGAELAGSRFYVLFDDGTVAEGVIASDGSQAGAIGRAVEGQSETNVTVSVNGFTAGSPNATYGGDIPEIVVTGQAGQTVLVTLGKGVQPVTNDANGIEALVEGRLAESQPDFIANNAFDIQTIEVTIGVSGTVTLPATAFDYNNASSGEDFNGSDVAPIVVSAVAVDADGYAAGSLDRVYLSNPTQTPVDPTPPASEGFYQSQNGTVVFEAENGVFEPGETGNQGQWGVYDNSETPDSRNGQFVRWDSGTDTGPDNNAKISYRFVADQGGDWTVKVRMASESTTNGAEENDVFIRLVEVLPDGSRVAVDPNPQGDQNPVTNGGSGGSLGASKFMKLYVGGNKLNDWAVGGSNVDFNAIDVEWTLEEGKIYEVQMAGRSSGTEIDAIALSNKGGSNSAAALLNNGAPESPFVPTGDTDPTVDAGFQDTQIEEVTQGDVVIPIPANAFADVDGDELSYSVISNPPGATLSPDGQSIIIPQNLIALGAGTSITVTVEADDTDVGNPNAVTSFAVDIVEEVIAQPVGFTMAAGANDDQEFGSALTSPDLEGNLGYVVRFIVPEGIVDLTSVTSAILTGENEDAGTGAPTYQIGVKDTTSPTLDLLSGTGDLAGDVTVPSTPSGPTGTGARFTLGDIADAVNALIASQGPLNAGDAITVVVPGANPRRDVEQGTLELAINGLSGDGGGDDNQQPVVDQEIPDQLATVGEAFVDLDVSAFFSDPDLDTLNFVALGLPDGLDLQNGVISGAPTESGAFDVTVTASDGELSIADTFTLTVSEEAQNAAPTGDQASLTAEFGAALTIDLNNAFTDPDSQPQPLSFQIEGNLPAGVSFNQATGVISGTPVASGDFPITVTVSDGEDTITDTFTLTVSEEAQNAAPTGDQASLTAEFGAALTIDLNNAFTDPDSQPQPLSFQIEGNLPAGVSFNQATGVISGTPVASGDFPITVTVSDGEDTITDTFTLTVGTASSLPTMTIGANEAEDLALVNYEVEGRSNASGGQAVKLPFNNFPDPGTVSGQFSGPAGQYEIAITIFNEDDGVATWRLLVDGQQQGLFTGEGGSGGTGSLQTETFTVNLQPGDTIVVEGTAGTEELARVDVINITPVNVGATIDVGSTEVETLVLDGYDIEGRSNASSNQVVKLPGGDDTGTAQGTFVGPDGTYQLDLTVFNESDGVATWRVLVDGDEQASFTGEGGVGGTGAPETFTAELNLQTGQTITFEGIGGGGELARMDAFELTPTSPGAAASTSSFVTSDAMGDTSLAFADGKSAPEAATAQPASTSDVDESVLNDWLANDQMDLTSLPEPASVSDGVDDFGALFAALPQDAELSDPSKSGDTLNEDVDSLDDLLYQEDLAQWENLG